MPLTVFIQQVFKMFSNLLEESYFTVLIQNLFCALNKSIYDNIIDVDQFFWWNCPS